MNECKECGAKWLPITESRCPFCEPQSIQSQIVDGSRYSMVQTPWMDNPYTYPKNGVCVQ